MSDGYPDPRDLIESPKFRYIFVSEDFTISGTNDTEKARKAAEFTMVWDIVTGEYIAGTTTDETEATVDAYRIEEAPEEWFTGVDPESI